MSTLKIQKTTLTSLFIATTIISNLHAADENGQNFDGNEGDIEELNRLRVADNAIDLDIERIEEGIDQLAMPAASASVAASVAAPAAYALVVHESDAMMRLAKALAKNGGPELSPQMSAFIDCFGLLLPEEQRTTLRIFNTDTDLMGSDILSLQIIASSFGCPAEARKFLNERAFVTSIDGSN